MYNPKCKLFCGTFPERMKGVNQRNLTTSRVLHSSLLLVDLHLAKILLFLRNTSRMSKVYQEFRTEIMEIKVAEINAPLINGVEINVHKK